MLHTALERDNKNYIPCTLEELKKVPNIDYWALGHIHKPSILSVENPVIAFSGIPQGRDMGEQGIGGVFLVEASQKEIISMELLPISTVIYKRVEIILGEEDNIENFSDLIKIILKKIISLNYENYEIPSGIKWSKDNLLEEFKGHIVQLIIRGRTDLHSKIAHMNEEDYEQFVEHINEELYIPKHFLWIDSIIFRTAPPIQEFESLKVQNPIFKDLEELINLYTEESEYRNQLLKNWGSIWKKQIYTENIEEDKFDFNEDVIQDIILQAKELVIEELVKALEIT
jgi:exonuclease SbcD